MTQYKVLVDDNFHYMDESDRYTLGVCGTFEEALLICKRRVEEDLKHFYKPGMSAEELFAKYSQFGEDPFIVATKGSLGDDQTFSAWRYARERAREIAGEKSHEAGVSEPRPQAPGR